MAAGDDGIGRRFWRLLRSRRLAIWLLLLAAIYQVVAVSLPALGAEGFSSPPFIALAGLLGLSTAACAWERTAHALRLLREPQGVPEPLVERLRRREPVVVLSGGIEAARTGAKAALVSLGLSVRGTPAVLRGRAAGYGPLGSPLFHWGLALLFLAVGLGRVSRSEGLIGVPEGESGLLHTAAAYGRLERGPLYLNPYEGARLHVVELRELTRPDGLDLGLVPRVRLVQGGRTLAEGDVYANHPLRHSTVLVHYDEWGFFGRFAVLGPTGETIDETIAYFDIAEKGGAILPATVRVTSPDRGAFDVNIRPKPRSGESSATAERQVAVAWTTASGEETSTSLAVGDTASVDGASVRFSEAGRYARLSFVDDWSVYPIYALLGIAIAGLAIAILAPRRTAWVLLEERPEGIAVKVLAVHDRKDPTFEQLVADELKSLADGTEEA